MPLSLTAIIHLESSIETGTSLIKDGYKYINLSLLFSCVFSPRSKFLISSYIVYILGLMKDFRGKYRAINKPLAIVVTLSLGTSNRREPTDRYVVDRIQVDTRGGERTDDELYDDDFSRR